MKFVRKLDNVNNLVTKCHFRETIRYARRAGRSAARTPCATPTNVLSSPVGQLQGSGVVASAKVFAPRVERIVANTNLVLKSDISRQAGRGLLQVFENIVRNHFRHVVFFVSQSFPSRTKLS